MKNSFWLRQCKTSEGEIIVAYNQIITRFKKRRINPKKHILDNEYVEPYKEVIKANMMTYELVPRDIHQRNVAEKAVQTFKDHFVAILCGIDTNFLLHLWDRLLPQAEMTLNILR